ncbi:type VI secretion system-associated protein TagO [Escherichia coli]|uniref:type VI secretion system-associated protein TagO n=4 Tax=Enterobacterales TaxID=91347 RepID=UPI00208DD671|nr:type VI secretion system-associated protein TagO [Escherichia coli]
MTDQTDFVALNLSPDSYNKAGTDRATSLVLRCSDNKTDAYLSFNDYMGSDNPRITVRLDGGKPVKSAWGGGEGGDSAFAPQPIQFIKTLAKHKKAIFGFEPYGSTMQVVEFDLSEIDKVVEKISQSCNWK